MTSEAVQSLGLYKDRFIHSGLDSLALQRSSRVLELLEREALNYNPLTKLNIVNIAQHFSALNPLF
jgi:hypothetical protein